METFQKQIQLRNLQNLISLGGLKTTDTFFPYTSGQIGGYFVQSIDITKDGKAYAEAIADMAKLIRRNIGESNFDVISGGETRDWDFSNPVAVALEKPHTKLYKDKKPLGASMEGKRVLHVADLNNEGSSPKHHWVPQIWQAQGTIDDMVFFVDRLEDGVDEIRSLGINRHVVVPLDQVAWQYMLDNNVFDKATYDSFNARLDDKQAWAHNMLFAHTDKLKNILVEPSSHVKGMKILKFGYPEIQDELIDRLNYEGYTVDREELAKLEK